MVKIFKVRHTERSWKTVILTDSDVKSQAQAMVPVLFLPVEDDMNFYSDKTRHDTI